MTISPIPSIIKYMGSKKPIIEFIASNLIEINKSNNIVCDLFAGSCTISASLRNRFNFISNDIQKYSAILGDVYFSNYSIFDVDEITEDIFRTCAIHAFSLKSGLEDLLFDYTRIIEIRQFWEAEEKQRSLAYHNFLDCNFYLFTKYYSGTYWSFQQCIWIDSLRRAAEDYRDTPIFSALIASIMYAMSYTSQSTGHFAQYRFGNTKEAMNDIIKYRKRDLYKHFEKKFRELLTTLSNPTKEIKTLSVDYLECLQTVPDGSTVYADPPYAPVHYSRYYHALETLIAYDYPEIEFKGRYRKDRHQSPFSVKTTAENAFYELLCSVKNKNSQLALSYSDNGIISIDHLEKLIKSVFSKSYRTELKKVPHTHSTMGNNSKKDVLEYLFIASHR